MDLQNSNIRSIGIYEILNAPKTPIGTFDAETFKKKVIEKTKEGVVNLVLDLSAIDTLYSDAFNALMSSRALIQEAKGRMGILAANDSVKNMLKKAGFDQFVDFFDVESDIMDKTIEIMKQTNEVPVVSAEEPKAPPTEKPKTTSQAPQIKESEAEIPEEHVEKAPKQPEPEPSSSDARQHVETTPDEKPKRTLVGWLVLSSFVFVILISLLIAAYFVWGERGIMP